MGNVSLVAASDIQSVCYDLRSQLDAGEIFPICQVDGRFFDEVCDDIDDLATSTPPEQFGRFSVRNIDQLSPNTQKLVEGIAAVSLYGFDIFTEDDLQSYVCEARDTMPHRDNGHSHIVNITRDGRRETTVRSEDNVKASRELTRGSISLIRAYEVPGPYVNCLSHDVKLLEPGRFLQVTYGNRRYDLDAMSRPA